MFEPHATLTRTTCVFTRIKGRPWFAVLLQNCEQCTTIYHSDEPNAIIFIQVLAPSHRAQVLNLEQCMNARTHTLRSTMLLTCLTYPLPACVRAHLHTLMHMPHLHHHIAHTFIHAYLFIYTCRFSFIHSCCQLCTRTHTDTHVSVPPLTDYTTTQKSSTHAQHLRT